MAYDKTTYGNSPFGQPTQTAQKTVPVSTRPVKKRGATGEATAAPEPLSDQMGESDASQSATESPELPTAYTREKPRQHTVSLFYVPKGRVAGLTMLGEALGWLMAWGTVGFFRAYIPAPVTLVFDRCFTPWGMATTTLISALLLGQLLKRAQQKIASLRSLATTAIEYGELHHRADAQVQIDELLTQVEAQTENASRWVVSWLTALGCLFIIGAFY
jgi:hypothetical protein